MKYHITKLDRRHSGHWHFKYRVEFHRNPGINKQLIFCDVRNWCDDTYGHSCERDIVGNLPDPKPVWAWHSDFDSGRYWIFLKDDTELSLFQLKFVVDQK